MLELKHCTREPELKFQKRAHEAMSQLLERRDLGFLQIPERDELWQSSLNRARILLKESSQLAILGIGGSSLGAEALVQALDRGRHPSKIVFFDNVDPIHFADKFNCLQDRVHWLLVSKSGGTIETLTQADFVAQMLREKNQSLARDCTVITESRDNPLSRWAQSHGVMQLTIPEDVGGRYSVLTPAGLLPAAFLEFDLKSLKEGAIWARENRQLAEQLVAHSLQSFQREEWITMFWSYCDTLRTWGSWTQQLWAESLAKTKSRSGEASPRVSTPLPCVGTCDQHSLLQQVVDGFHDKFVWFLRVEENEQCGPLLKSSEFGINQKALLGKSMGALLAAEAEATRQALAQRNVHSLTLQLERVNEYSLGALFMILEITVGALGEALDVNAFDQPGVEQGKTLARQILQNWIG